MTKKVVVLVLTVLLTMTQAVYAVEDQFTITQTVIGADADAPSVPLNLEATPVSTTQIDLSWDASTDNIAVTGYQVFRDNVQIATSTGTTYSDTGLTANTTYDYNVTAFDAALNISARSATTSATTLSEGGGEGSVSGGTPLELTHLSVVPSLSSTVLVWGTSRVSRSIVRWGETGSYELGSIADEQLALEHTTIIENLKPATTYAFVIVGFTSSGQEYVLVRSEFTTASAPDREPPSNVWNLQAEVVDEDIRLTWENPLDLDFDHVRLLRSPDFFPGDPQDGFFLYEGGGEEYLDRGIVREGGTAYYTIFAYDEEGNVSSGAIVRVVIIGEDLFVEGDEVLIDFSDLIFIQGGQRVEPQDNRVRIDAGRQLTAAVLYGALPEHLKTITVTLVDPQNTSRTFSFLLRINEDKTAYVASIAPLGESGTYPLALSVFDFKRENLTTVRGYLEAELMSLENAERNLIAVLTAINPYFFGTVLVLLLLLAHRLIRGRVRSRIPQYRFATRF